MKHPSRHSLLAPHSLRPLFAALVLAGLLASCSDKGVHMPKHRKRRHCDCPTFALATPLPAPAADGTIVY